VKVPEYFVDYHFTYSVERDSLFFRVTHDRLSERITLLSMLTVTTSSDKSHEGGHFVRNPRQAVCVFSFSFCLDLQGYSRLNSNE